MIKIKLDEGSSRVMKLKPISSGNSMKIDGSEIDFDVKDAREAYYWDKLIGFIVEDKDGKFHIFDTNGRDLEVVYPSNIAAFKALAVFKGLMEV